MDEAEAKDLQPLALSGSQFSGATPTVAQDIRPALTLDYEMACEGS